MKQDYPASSTEPVCSRPVDAMTNLSPAAQAVKDAAQELYAERMARKMAWPLDLPVVAAALRAAADQLREAYANEEYVDSADDWLDAIAAELESQ